MRRLSWLMIFPAFALLAGACSDSDDAAEQPEPVTTTTTSAPVTEAPTTQPEEPTTAAVDISGEWQQVAVDEPWIEGMIDVAALPGGGFVVLSVDPTTVMWSPDGVEWRDGDPQRLITPYPPDPAWVYSLSREMAVTADRVVVLDGAEDGVWVGDPTTGDWQHLGLEMDEPADPPDLLTVVANDREALVVSLVQRSSESGSTMLDDRYVVWILDPATGASDRHVVDGLGGHSAYAAWLDGHWIVITDDAIRVSADGVEWSEHALPDAWRRSGVGVFSMTAGASSVIVAGCGGVGPGSPDSLWLSHHGVEWTPVAPGVHSHLSTYSDELGFVAGYETLVMSDDGEHWVDVRRPRKLEPLVASEHQLLAVDNWARPAELWLWSTS